MNNYRLKIINFKLQKRLSALVMLLLFFAASCFANSLTDSAAVAYSKQEYKRSINLYEKVLFSGNTSYALYYNLGNAYFKDNQLGRAIYYYELAKKLNPNDEDIKNNLQLANTKTIDKIESKENYFAGAIKSGIYTLFSTNGWARINIIALFLSLAFFFVFIISKKMLFKRAGFLLGAACAITFFASFFIGYAALHDLNKKNQAIVTAQVVQVLNAPTTHGKSKFSLHEGTKLIVLSTNEEWTSVQLANGNEGWIRTQELGLF